MKISDRIKVLRDERGWTQTDLAVKVGTDQPTVSDWERGATEPSFTSIRGLARAFGQSVGEFLDEEQTTSKEG